MTAAIKHEHTHIFSRRPGADAASFLTCCRLSVLRDGVFCQMGMQSTDRLYRSWDSMSSLKRRAKLIRSANTRGSSALNNSLILGTQCLLPPCKGFISVTEYVHMIRDSRNRRKSWGVITAQVNKNQPRDFFLLCSSFVTWFPSLSVHLLLW